ncbi:GatB/YqeY domain-containing protein [Patescibacteria group bacterium]|nr:GatB/YqeY domain-containing protein [Patescibacteria group bacterium]MBU1966792.1 GatB/YqeY domain-containing protein [Patescibacteria group bacterium]
MSLSQQLVEDMKRSMKSGDKIRLGTIRFLRSQIKNFEIDHGEQDDAGVEKIIVQQVKQIKESIEEFQKAGRVDLVSEEQIKLKVLEEYLPEQMSDQEIEAVVKEALSGIEDPQVGPVIGAVMSQVRGKADGSRVAALVRQALST